MKIRVTSMPHDAVFKQFLSHPETARDFLLIHLPPALCERCDLQTLKLEPTSFIEDNLRAYYSDVLWSLKTDEGEGYIYVLIEHQSTADPHMAFRLMRYAVAAMQRYLDAGYKTLPLVVPMLFYHGEASPYPYSLCWLDEFASPTLAREVYATAFPLVDITVMPDDEIVHHRRIALLELMQKHIRQRDLLRIVDKVSAILLTGFTNDSQLKTLFNYLIHSPGAPEVGRFIQEIIHRVPQHKEAFMTNGEILQKMLRRLGRREGRKEGLAKGLEKGLEEGLEKGIVKGLEKGLIEGKHAEAVRIARTMLAEGMALEIVQKITGLTADDIVVSHH